MLLHAIKKNKALKSLNEERKKKNVPKSSTEKQINVNFNYRFVAT